MTKIRFAASLLVLAIAGLSFAEDPKPKEVTTDPADPSLPVDFKIQGEYVSDKAGAQIIALGKGAFQAVVYAGGLPGAGWDGKNKSLVAGMIDGKTAKFEPAKGKRKYIAGSAAEFSATSKFPPEGQIDYSGTCDGSELKLASDDGKSLVFKKTDRQSPTLGAKPPEGAIVLFDGTSNSAWTGGRVDEKTKFLNTDGKDINTKQKFNNYSMHLEFMLPYRPDARGQGRGNSGFYQVLMYEVQVLDSFGLDGKDNECGGVYTKAAPKVNMCLPPLTWQTYDAEFTNAVSEDGKVVKKSRLTLKHNGVVVQDNIEINGKTGGARNDPEGTPGPIQLQGHGNPLQYRNIWIIEKK
ncbi:3-keto-disaccharide hydrolase [Zavarzinella formosa]|uniref:3-keto-disaccharide hydrolase n=1 Tax=Zavarzinella formosa TaxID=360055 RepID=UPI0002D81A27|nr:DUF1080 domain-containing protein [Zavarzinella formosa]